MTTIKSLAMDLDVLPRAIQRLVIIIRCSGLSNTNLSFQVFSFRQNQLDCDGLEQVQVPSIDICWVLLY